MFVCNEWTFRFLQYSPSPFPPIPHPDTGSYTFIVDCSALPFTIDLPINPVAVAHGYDPFIYYYDVIGCDRLSINGTFT